MDIENKEYEVEELVQLYERLVENIQQLAMDAKYQIEKLKGFAVADEIASDISDVAKPYALILLKNEWMSPEQFEAFENIDKKLEEMSKNKDLWTESALVESWQWEDCRKRGRELLQLLEH